MTAPRAVVGVDGCKAGWIAVVAPIESFAAARALVVNTFADLLALPEQPTSIAVDMPIGLADHSGRGRRAEIELRPMLGRRRSSIFPIPSRNAVYASDYAQARKIALETSDPPRSVAKQAFNIFPKIREIDALLRGAPHLASRVFECHPEGSFRMMQGAPLAFPKRHASGVAERRALLLGAGFTASLLDGPPPLGAAGDDLFDACAATWTARRIGEGAALRWPREVWLDAHGLPMAIWT